MFVLSGVAGSELAPRVNTHIDLRVEGIAARVVVTQEFFNGTADWAVSTAWQLGGD